MRCWFGHAWERWEQYNREHVILRNGVPTPGVVRNVLRQKRACLRCGFQQDEPVRVEDRPGGYLWER